MKKLKSVLSNKASENKEEEEEYTWPKRNPIKPKV